MNYYQKDKRNNWIKEYGKECFICGEKFFNQKASKTLTAHLKKHNISKEDFIIKYFLKEKKPKCVYCGKEVSLSKDKKYFLAYCSRSCKGKKELKFDSKTQSERTKKLWKKIKDLGYDFRNNGNGMKGRYNPWYGKPTPKGCGVGWSGWYKGIFFRSILELSAMVFFEKENIKYISGESEKIKKFYYKHFNGNDRTYRTDFYLPEFNIYCECKYKKIINSKEFKLKKQAVLNSGEFFIELTEKDIPILNEYDLFIKYWNKELVWMDKYKKKFIERVNKKCLEL